MQVMKMRYSIYFAVLSLIVLMFSTCGPSGNKEAETDEIYREVMEIHDEVMPKMQDIMNLKEKMRIKIDSMASSGVDQSAIDKMEKMITQLDEADEAMMNWMRNFNTDYEEMSKEEITNYLNEQKEEITEVKDQMQTAIKEAESMLAE